MIVMTTFLSLIWPWKGKPLIENEDDFKLLLRSQPLSPAFGGMIAFGKETEPLLGRGQGQVIKPDESMSAAQYLFCKYILYFRYSFLFCVLYKLKSLGSDDDFCCGCQNVSGRHHRQLLPGPLLHCGTHHTTSCSACY